MGLTELQANLHRQPPTCCKAVFRWGFWNRHRRFVRGRGVVI